MNYGFVCHVQMLDMWYKFLSSNDGEDIPRYMYCTTCKLQVKIAVTEDKIIEDKCKKYTKKLNQKMKSIEVTIQKNADVTKLRKKKVKKWK